ncbi:MAG: hypothetical protein JWM80_5796 [Cyanobacteria bacterium RYN_339]|nr:hypothetical protein [Cyanobacteria bacterium RYN_339]
MKPTRPLLLLALALAGCPSDPVPPTAGKPKAQTSTSPGVKATTGPSAAPTATPTPVSTQGLVLGVDAKPAANVAVHGYVGEVATLETKTDAQGRFTLTNKDGTPFTVEAVASDQVKAIAQAVGKTDGLTLQLATVGAITGKVTAPAAPGVKDFAGVLIAVAGTAYQAKTDAAGAFTLANLPVGTFSLVGQRSGLGKGRLDGVVVATGKAGQAPDLVLTPLVPKLTTITPANAGPGATVTLTGEQFGTASDFSVRFAGTLANQPVRKDDHTIEVAVPAGARSGDVTVTLEGIASEPKPFTVIKQVTLTSALRFLVPGEHHRYVATATDTDGKPIAAPSLAWLSSGTAVEVDATGVVTAKAAGKVKLTAASGTVSSDGFDLEVSADPVVVTSVVDGAFTSPVALALDADDTCYVADLSGKVLKCTPDGDVTTLAEVPAPRAIAVDVAHNCFVLTGSKILKISPEGKVTAFAGADITGSADGAGAGASFKNPLGLAIAFDGTLFVHDTGNARVRAVSPAGVVSTLSIGAAGSPVGPTGSAGPIAIGVDGSLYLGGPGASFARVDISDRAHPTLAAILPDAFTPGPKDTAPGGPSALTADATGNVFYGDPVSGGGGRLREINRATPAHPAFITLLGLAGSSIQDGPAATAGLSTPTGIVASRTNPGVFYFTEWGAQKGQQRLRRLTIKG